MNLGLPLPGPDGKGIATLEQAAADAKMLRQMDVGGAGYPVTADNIKSVVVFIEADIPYLARRMRVFENQLTGSRKLVLSVAAARLAEQLAKVSQVRDVQIWPGSLAWYGPRQNPDKNLHLALAKEFFLMEIEDVQMKRKLVQEGREAEVKEAAQAAEALNRGEQPQAQPRPPEDLAKGEAHFVVRHRKTHPLWTGRQRHFQGRYDRPADVMQAINADDAAESAKSLYLDARVMTIQGARNMEEEKQVQEVLTKIHAMATYWLGLVNYEQGAFAVAEKFFDEVVKGGTEAPFHAGALYNLGRAHEAAGQKEQAVKYYETPGVSMPNGCKLRAKWLKEKGTK
jgi:tetratricopeptide (TPR) repeat protein